MHQLPQSLLRKRPCRRIYKDTRYNRSCLLEPRSFKLGVIFLLRGGARTAIQTREATCAL